MQHVFYQKGGIKSTQAKNIVKAQKMLKELEAHDGK